MKYFITIPQAIWVPLRRHLFHRNKLEQGAFLFARATRDKDTIRLDVMDFYLIPPKGWEVQLEFHLEMKDTERAKLMKFAQDGDYAIIDCHSHPHSGGGVEFSSSDRIGIAEFAGYAKWKLDGKPFTALVWGESSVDAVAWCGDFKKGEHVDEIVIGDKKPIIMKPKNTWFNPRFYWKGQYYEYR